MHPFLFHNMGAGHGDKGLKTYFADLFDSSALSGCPSSRLCVRYAKEQSANVSTGKVYGHPRGQKIVMLIFYK